MKRRTSTKRPRTDGLSIHVRLAMLSALLCALVTVGGAVALIGLRDAGENADRTMSHVSPWLDANRTIRATMLDAQASLRGYQLTMNVIRANPVPTKEVQAQAKDYLDSYTKAEGGIDGQLSRLEDGLTRGGMTDDPRVRAELLEANANQKKAAHAWFDYARTTRASFDRSNDLEAAGDARFAEFEAANERLSTRLVSLRQDFLGSIRDTLTLTQNQVVMATAVAVAIAGAVAWWTMRDLSVPLGRLRDTLRRQRSGRRDAWADEALGSREVRELAAGLNELTASQHALLDEQSYALRLSQANRELSRQIQDASDVESAFVMAVESVGRALLVDHTLCLATQVDVDQPGVCVVWSPEEGVAMREVPGEVLLDLVDHVQGIWLGERYVVADDVTTVVVPPAVPSEHWYDVGGCILAAFGSAERPRGVLVVRDTAGPRAWSQAESVFVQQIAGELGRAVAATEARQARTEHVSRLEELDRQKDAFLSTVSHELRTPLTSINGYLELLEDGDAGELTEEQRHMLGVIERNAVRLRGLIEDLLFLNRMRGGHDLPRERVDLDTLITQTVEEMLPVAQARGVQLQVAALGGAQTHGDRDQLARVLTNVVSNAVKFTPSGRRVRIRVAPGPGEDWVRIVCVDEGIGIPESEQAQLFTRFFRASNATRNEVPGTGLGLVVVRGIVEAHGGQLELTSTEDVGTTVTIHLPRLPAAAEGAFSSVARGLAH